MTTPRKHDHDDDPKPKAEPSKFGSSKPGDPPLESPGPPPSTFAKGAPGEGTAKARPAGEWEHSRPADQPAKDEKPKEALKGTLYAAEGGELYLMGGEGQRGACYAVGTDPVVEINGKVTKLGLADLKRGDEVVLEGDPVTKVVAVRRNEVKP